MSKVSKVILTKGLPASGKSTFAKELVAKDVNWVRINKDDLRSMLYGKRKWKGNMEKLVEQAEESLLLDALRAGKNVVIDNTHLNPRHEQRFRGLICVFQNDDNNWKPYKEGLRDSDLMPQVDVEVRFFPVDPEEAIKRDLQRERSVGSKVIWDMWNRWLAPKQAPTPAITSSLVVICDIDGTMALFGNKNPYDRDFENDEVNHPVAHALGRLGLPVIFLSGRSGKFEDVTSAWLIQVCRRHNIDFKELHMRAAGDNRKDSIIKRELYETFVNGIHNVFAVFDDRDSVVRLWRSLGLTCFQVAPGDF
jgi:predicted kinase